LLTESKGVLSLLNEAQVVLDLSFFIKHYAISKQEIHWHVVATPDRVLSTASLSEAGIIVRQGWEGEDSDSTVFVVLPSSGWGSGKAVCRLSGQRIHKEGLAKGG
jgi:hypothetical protein